MTIDLRLGDYRDVLADVTCDALITDPPFSARTHEGHRAMVDTVTKDDRWEEGKRGPCRRAITYTAWTPADVAEFVAFWAPRTRGWMACMTDTDLIQAYRAAYEAAGRYAFSPVWITQNSVRLVGDGPASPGVYLMVSYPQEPDFGPAEPGVYMMVSRPRTVEFSRWGALPGRYDSHRESGRRIGGKPISLMRDIVRDYSREGDLVCDPCAGHGSTLYAARQCGRLAVGAEIDPGAHSAALGLDLGDSEGQLVML